MGKTYRKSNPSRGFFDDEGYYESSKGVRLKNKKRRKALLKDDYETDENHVFLEKMRKRQ